MSIFGSIMGAIFGHGAQAKTAEITTTAAPGTASASTSPASTSAAPGTPAAQTVDVAAIVDKAAAATGEKLDWRTSIVDLMKALGYRVSPLEVEAALLEHPAIAEVACAEVRVRADVSVIGAFIVLKDGVSPSVDDVERFAAERLAAYKRPRAIVFVDALPRTANGKLMRAALKPPDDFSTG